MEVNKNLLKEKYQQLSNLKKEIDNIEIEYAKINSKFKEGDIVISSNIRDTIFKITGDFDYSFESDLIYAECSVLTTSNKSINIDIIYSISESNLILQENE
jgi:hypothetical protein